MAQRELPRTFDRELSIWSIQSIWSRKCAADAHQTDPPLRRAARSPNEVGETDAGDASYRQFWMTAVARRVTLSGSPSAAESARSTACREARLL